jgi:diguanylate cyclase (GGDEF)-like protein/PAS domain S-box-containing protein
MSELFTAGNYAFSWYAVPLMFVAGLNISFGASMLVRERASSASLAYAFLITCSTLWFGSFAAIYLTEDEAVARGWVNIEHLGVGAMPLAQYVFASSVARTFRWRSPIMFAGVLWAVFVCTLAVATDWMITDVRRYCWGYYPIYGWPVVALLAFFVVYIGLGSHAYRRAYRSTRSALQRRRMRTFLAAISVANFATIDFLPAFGIAVYPFGYVFVTIALFCARAAMWRDRLVDITPALAAKQIMDTMSEGLLVLDRDGVVRVANDAASATWGAKSVAGMSCAQLDERWGQEALVQLQDPEERSELEVTYTTDGQPRTVDVRASKLPDHRGDWVGTVYILHDITERWRAERALRESEERFRSLVQNASDLITVIDPDTRVRYQSPAIQRVLGFDPEASIGRRLVDLVHPDDAARFLAALGDLMTKPAGTITGEGRVRDVEGVWRHLEFTGSDQRAHPAIGGLVLNVRDVTERKRLEDQLRHQALHDPLTQLANRTRFSDRLEHALAPRTRSSAHVAVIFIDLDNFKGVNDSLGHSAGDRLLSQVAERVTRCLRPGDTVARLGGDEFAILLEDIAGIEDAETAADRVFAALRDPFILEGKEVSVRASAGIATTAQAGAADAGALLRDADIAMYAAKSQGRDCYRVFEPGMRASMVERLELLADLPRAVEEGQLLLHYQPIFLLQGGRLSGVEALVRWRHPQRGLLSPQQFIPLAEESGAILPIGKWILRQACQQAVRWTEQFPGQSGWTISVNVSARQLEHPAFGDEVAAILHESGLAPRRLILEITESVMMGDVDLMLERLRALKGLGVGLAIDDFGTGYSSLSYLRQFPFDLLKIDKSFIDDLGTIVGRKEFTRAIVELGKSLDVELVAEGIERGEQLARLQSMECELGQGFLFAKPMASEGVEALLRSLADGADAAA